MGIGAIACYLLISLSFYGPNGAIDSEHFNHWVKTIFAFGGSGLDTSVTSPFQGMGGLCQPLAVRLHIPYLLGYIVSPGNSDGIVTVTSAFLLAMATVFLCRSLRTGWLTAMFAGQVAAVFFFPPMWLLLLRWSHLMTTELFSYLPAVSYPVTLGTVFLGFFLRLGRGTLYENVTYAAALGIIFIYAILVDPLYTTMFWIPVCFFCAGILIGSESRRILIWRLAGGIIIFSVCWLLGIFTYIYALFGNAARSVFPNELYVEIQQWDKLTGLFSHGGGSFITALLIVISCLLLSFRAGRQARWLAISVGAYFALMICVSLVYVYSGVRWNLPLPVYLEVGAAPVYLGAICAAVPYGIDFLGLSRHLTKFRLPPVTGFIALPLISAVTLIVIKSTIPGIGNGPSQLITKESDGIVSKVLAPIVALGTDGRFRGSVATVAAVPGGEIMRRAGVPDNAPFTKENINFLCKYLRSYDPHLYMTGLWEMGIPTLEDNNHLVTPPFYFLFSRALCRPRDFQSRNWTLCTTARPNLMAALGARLLVSDLSIEDPRMNKVATQSNADGIPLYIYEISKPNLGNYSPTQLLEIGDAVGIVATMQAPDFPFQDKAIVTSKSGMPLLVAADFGELFFERGGVRVRAASQGWSLLVLPVQFSNSLQIVDRLLSDAASPPRLLRVNLLQTGVLFHGRIHIKVDHVFGPFRGAAGRMQDIKDWKALGITEDGCIPYPPNFQPLAW